MTFSEFIERRGPITINWLASAFGVPRRVIEEEIQRLRLEGVPLITDSDGVHWSTDPNEIRECAERLRSRAITQMETASALSKTAERMSGPMVLWRDAA